MYDVVISNNLQKKEVGTYIHWAHPFIQWLGKYFPIRSYKIGAPIEQEQALIIGNKMFMSPLMWQAYKNETVTLRGDCT